MKTCNQSDAWICHTAIVLGAILLISVAGVIILLLIKQSVSEIFVALGLVAGAGLAKLFISPLNQKFFE